ncbi:MAG: aminotransferase class V-fold PLP-dependent enzyme [Anaerolineaceae bacterium]
MSNLSLSSFLLDPSVAFLNHGSFGACPAVVFDEYCAWQRRLENQPVLYLGREYPRLDRDARHALGRYLGVHGDDVVFVPNATHGVNIAARSIPLRAGDEILTTDHEYGACNYTWQYLCQQTGARYIMQPIDLPARSSEEIVEQLWRGVNERTRVIYLSHLTSPTALIMPVAEICARARAAGIVTVIDGAHAPGQLPLNLSALDPDFYTGNCHKWMLSPKGAGFLYVRRSIQPQVQPLVVSWGRQALPEKSAGSQFVDDFTWTGTQDPAAYFSVPAAIRFLEQHDWPAVRARCHELLRSFLPRIRSITGMPAAYPDESELYGQMAVCLLPPETDIDRLKERLYDDFMVEVPLIDWNGRKLLRISVQCYNTPEDLNRLTQALAVLLPQTARVTPK